MSTMRTISVPRLKLLLGLKLRGHKLSDDDMESLVCGLDELCQRCIPDNFVEYTQKQLQDSIQGVLMKELGLAQ